MSPADGKPDRSRRLYVYWGAALVTALLAGGCGAHLPDPVGHAVDVHAGPWSTELAPAVKVLLVQAPAAAKRKSVATSPDGRMRAFILDTPDDPDRQIELVCLERVATGETFAVRGVPLPHRPSSDLAWASNRYLVFDRWS